MFVRDQNGRIMMDFHGKPILKQRPAVKMEMKSEVKSEVTKSEHEGGSGGAARTRDQQPHAKRESQGARAPPNS